LEEVDDVFVANVWSAMKVAGGEESGHNNMGKEME